MMLRQALAQTLFYFVCWGLERIGNLWEEDFADSFSEFPILPMQEPRFLTWEVL